MGLEIIGVFEYVFLRSGVTSDPVLTPVNVLEDETETGEWKSIW